MGTYLTIQLRHPTITKAKMFNQLWKKFSADILDPDLPSNFYKGTIGDILYFETGEGVKEWAENAIKNNNLSHLGIYPHTQMKEAIKILKATFPEQTKIGKAEIKLSGGHTCTHILKKIRGFLDRYPEALTYSDEGGSLDRYIDYNEIIITSAYCRKCVTITTEIGIKLPICHGDDDKNRMNSNLYNKLVEIIKRHHKTGTVNKAEVAQLIQADRLVQAVDINKALCLGKE